MTNRELDNLLKSASVPDRPPVFWDQFPGRVIDEITRQNRSANLPRRASPEILADRQRAPFASLLWRGAFVGGFAMICIVIGFALGLRRGHGGSFDAAQLALAQKFFNEVQTLFPNQIEAIEFDSKGTHLKLADHANLPASPPLYVSVCAPQGCRHFVTFSGQQIRVNGDVFDVLLDRQGEVLVVGKQWIWPDPNGEHPAPYRVEARLLPVTS